MDMAEASAGPDRTKCRRNSVRLYRRNRRLDYNRENAYRPSRIEIVRFESRTETTGDSRFVYVKKKKEMVKLRAHPLSEIIQRRKHSRVSP